MVSKSFTDHLGNSITLNFPPQRIISIVPSQTELLFDLGLDKEIVGISKFCIHPAKQFKQKRKVGGTKSLNRDAIAALQPDLIIGNKEENSQDDIEYLQSRYPVWMSDIYTLEDALKTNLDIAKLVDRQAEAEYLNYLISTGFRDLATLAQQNKLNAKVAYAIWKDPYMFAGKNTFIDDIMRFVGLRNVLQTERYPELSLQELAIHQPDFIFLSSEPYPFQEKHIAAVQALVPQAKILLVDGEMFSWYGSRLVKAVQYFFELQKSLSRY